MARGSNDKRSLVPVAGESNRTGSHMSSAARHLGSHLGVSASPLPGVLLLLPLADAEDHRHLRTAAPGPEIDLAVWAGQKLHRLGKAGGGEHGSVIKNQLCAPVEGRSTNCQRPTIPNTESQRFIPRGKHPDVKCGTIESHRPCFFRTASLVSLLFPPARHTRLQLLL